MIELIVNPPSLISNNFSKETVEEYEKERKDLLDSLKRRAKIVYDALNSMVNTTCNEIEGAMYAFP